MAWNSYVISVALMLMLAMLTESRTVERHEHDDSLQQPKTSARRRRASPTDVYKRVLDLGRMVKHLSARVAVLEGFHTGDPTKPPPPGPQRRRRRQQRRRRYQKSTTTNAPTTTRAPTPPATTTASPGCSCDRIELCKLEHMDMVACCPRQQNDVCSWHQPGDTTKLRWGRCMVKEDQATLFCDYTQFVAMHSCQACKDKAKKDECIFIRDGTLQVKGFCAGADEDFFCYRPEDETRPAQKVCSGKSQGDACMFDPDGWKRSGKCTDKFSNAVLVCDSDAGPGAPSLPPMDDPNTADALAACGDKPVGASCTFREAEGFCTGLNHNKKFWCYDPFQEKRPSQLACRNKAEKDSCTFNPDGMEKTGTCVARAGGMLRCHSDETKCQVSGTTMPPPTTTTQPKCSWTIKQGMTSTGYAGGDETRFDTVSEARARCLELGCECKAITCNRGGPGFSMTCSVRSSSKMTSSSSEDSHVASAKCYSPRCHGLTTMPPPTTTTQPQISTSSPGPQLCSWTFKPGMSSTGYAGGDETRFDKVTEARARCLELGCECKAITCNRGGPGFSGTCSVRSSSKMTSSSSEDSHVASAECYLPRCRSAELAELA